jgi:hypothetical protein
MEQSQTNFKGLTGVYSYNMSEFWFTSIKKKLQIPPRNIKILSF